MLAQSHSNHISSFVAEDINNDGILTTSQFIEGLITTFTASNFEKNMQLINDFGREFAGRKHTKGIVKISDVKIWLESNEIFDAYVDWRYIIEEGELHHESSHIHEIRKSKHTV